MKYNHKKIEKKWQRIWEREELYVAHDFSSKPKFYCLVEFPYPSGEGLHAGHPRSYTAFDIIARKRRMEGYEVLYPMGFDAFGLPAENYAIKVGVHPKIITKKNIKNFTRQLKSIGFSFDWTRAFSTTDPEYYKWTQWIFLKMFEHGLAYKAKFPINWCPKCKIGLANEEVVQGKCERCGNAVEKKEKEQWILKITKYAQRLIDDLDTVDYIERVKTQQINWIGRSEGAAIKFKVPSPRLVRLGRKSSKFKVDDLEVFTTRPDTLFGATFMVVSPENSLIENCKLKIENLHEVQKYIEAAKKKSDLERTESKEKTGVEVKGIKAINPVNGKEIPIFVADYVLATYGTGAIMAVPAHDQRDFEFAKKYNLEIIQVIKPLTPTPLPQGEREGGRGKPSPLAGEGVRPGRTGEGAYEDIENGVMINSGQFNGLPIKECMQKITQWLEEKKIGRKEIQYKLRDWVFSRQHYWGEPIPLIFCNNCKTQAESYKLQATSYKLNKGELLNPGWVPIPEEDLPVELPNVKKYEPTETGESPLAKMERWLHSKCPRCGGPAERETDVMPNWAGSNWYYLRYCDPKNIKTLADPEKLKYWMAPASQGLLSADQGGLVPRSSPSASGGGVDWYNGGMEHTTLHLLYSRFIYKFLWDIGAVPKELGPEPYKKRTSHGMILGQGREKMSKSRGNVVNPDEVIAEFGADVLRAYEMFIGPFDQAAVWDTKGILGIKRFLDRVWAHSNKFKVQSSQPKAGPPRAEKFKVKEDINILRLLHQTIKKVSEDIEGMRFNTALSALMILFNEIEKTENLSIQYFEKFLILLSVFNPHVCEEIWREVFGRQVSIFKEPWPYFDPKLIVSNEMQIVVQVNGRVRDKIIMPVGLGEKEVLENVLVSERVKKFVAREKIVRTIYVKGKLMNIVIK